MANLTKNDITNKVKKASIPELKQGKKVIEQGYDYSAAQKTQIVNLLNPILGLSKTWKSYYGNGNPIPNNKLTWPLIKKTGNKQEIEKFILRAPYEVIENLIFEYGSDNKYSPIKDTIKADQKSPKSKPSDFHSDTKENDMLWDIVTLKFFDQPITFIPSTDKITIPGPQIDATTMTAIQEMASAYIFKRAIKDNQDLTTPEKIRKNDNGNDFKELIKIWKGVGGSKVKTEEDAKNSIDAGGWLINFAEQNKKLLDKVKGAEFTIFTRGQTQGYTADWYDKGETFMEWVSEQVKERFDISKKDNWNPADVWLIKHETRHKNKILNAMKSPIRSKTTGVVSANLNQFNQIFRDLFKQKEIMGISLKKISGTEAKWKEVNVTEEFFSTIEATEMQYMGAKCKFGPKLYYETVKDDSGTNQKLVAGVTKKQAERATRIKNGKPPQNPLTMAGAFTLETQETMITVKDKDSNKEYEIQIKSNNSADFDNLKYEPKDKSATSARLGKATGEYVDELVWAYGISKSDWKKRWQEYPQSRDNPSDREKQQAFDDWKYFYPKDATDKKAIKEWEKTYSELAKEAQGSKPFNNAEKKDYLSMIKFIKQKGVDIGDVTPEEAVANLDEAFYRRSNRWVANSKCMQVVWLYNFLHLSKVNQNKLVTDIIFLAEKAGRRYGPYGKLY